MATTHDLLKLHQQFTPRGGLTAARGVRRRRAARLRTANPDLCATAAEREARPARNDVALPESENRP